MTCAHTTENPDYAFCPAYGPGNEPQEIRLVIDGMSGSIATALVVLTLEDGERLCDRLNARLGMDREAWSALAARAMEETPNDGSAG